MSTSTHPIHPHYRGACDKFKSDHCLEELADRLGMGGHVLRNKFNRAQKHKLSGEDLIALYHATKDETLIDGLLFECGLTASAIPDVERAPSMFHQVINLNADVAAIGQRTVELTERGRITRTERNTLVSRATAVMGSLAILIHDVEARFQAVPPLACASDILMQAATM